MRDSKAFGKFIEIETQYKNEQKKVKQLQRELEKMSMRQKKDSKNSFSLDLDQVMEINFKDL